jgi:nicotinamidase-related amidase
MSTTATRAEVGRATQETDVAKNHKSLLEIAGASLVPSSFGEAVLVLIDFQREYSEGGLRLEGAQPAIAEARELLKLAREAGTPVFHVVHHGRPGGALFDPNSQFIDIVPELEPIANEKIIVKKLPNSFAGTDLDAAIKTTSRKQLILAGFQTHMCVASTAHAALDLGYRTTIVASACATRPLSDFNDADIGAEALHSAILAALADRFAIVARDVAALEPVAA